MTSCPLYKIFFFKRLEQNDPVGWMNYLKTNPWNSQAENCLCATVVTKCRYWIIRQTAATGYAQLDVVVLSTSDLYSVRDTTTKWAMHIQENAPEWAWITTKLNRSMAINRMTAPCIVQYISWCVTWRPYEQKRGTASFLSRLSRHSRTVWDDDVKTQMTLFSWFDTVWLVCHWTVSAWKWITAACSSWSQQIQRGWCSAFPMCHLREVYSVLQSFWGCILQCYIKLS